MNLTPQWQKLIEELQAKSPEFGDLRCSIRFQDGKPYLLRLLKDSEETVLLNDK